MKVNLTPRININKTNNAQNQAYKPSAISLSSQDVFVKNSSPISFSGNEDKRKEFKSNLFDALAVASVVN